MFSYDIFAINIAAVMLGYVYGHGERIHSRNLSWCHQLTRHYLGQTLSENQDLGVKVATPIGNLFGQLLFGWLADVLGRKRMCTYCTSHASSFRL